MSIDGIKTGEDHRLELFKSRQSLDGGMSMVGDGVADFCMRYVLDVCHQKADFPCLKFIDLDRLWREHAELLHVEDFAVRPKPDLHPFAQSAGDNSRQYDDPAIGIEPGIEDQTLQGGVCRTFRRRESFDDGFEHLRNAFAC